MQFFNGGRTPFPISPTFILMAPGMIKCSKKVGGCHQFSLVIMGDGIAEEGEFFFFFWKGRCSFSTNNNMERAFINSSNLEILPQILFNTCSASLAPLFELALLPVKS